LRLVKDLNKLGMPCMVVKPSRKPMLVSIGCPPPSSNFVGVKNSQVLTHVIVALHCNLMLDINLIKELLIVTWVEELESRLHTTNSINNKLGVGMK
jgi:hypothetical protein